MTTQSKTLLTVAAVLIIVGAIAFAYRQSPPSAAEPETNSMIRVTSPKANDTVASPLTVEGQARGNWYFEASFPVKLFDANGKQLAVVPAAAQGEWMTEEFVPFKAVLVFPKPDTATGTLVLEKDNPSGLPEQAEEIRIPIVFNPD